MQIRFLRDFRSAATDEAFYEAGQVVDLLRGAEIVAEGAAEVVTVETRRGQAEPSKGKEMPVVLARPTQPLPRKRGR